MSYLNPDGLLVKFGTERAVPTKVGEYRTAGRLHEVQAEITLSSLATGSTILGDVTLIPAGVRLEEVVIVVKTAATGATATLNLGLIREDRTTAYDADGLVAALALTSLDAAGEKTIITVGSTGAGALLGTTTANKGYLVADYDTAAFTAGVIIVTVRYYVP